MGYAIIFGECFSCNKFFSFNPNYVPSIRIEGDKKPICKNCIEEVNPLRVKNGLSPIIIHPQAYEPENENNLRF